MNFPSTDNTNVVSVAGQCTHPCLIIASDNIVNTKCNLQGKRMETIKVFTAFSGYDSQMMALNRIANKHKEEIEFDLIGWSEIDKYAIKAHDLIFPRYKDRNYGDISKIEWSKVPDFDLFTYSSPCQDWSAAGLQRGGQEGSGTRSSLLWECRKAIIAKKPKYLLLENVKALVSKKFLPYFDKWRRELEEYGYYNYCKVMNAKNFGVPQNRERVFLLSIRKDVDGGDFRWPEEFELTTFLKDVLEENVDDKYYLSEKSIEGFISHNENHEKKGTGFI